MEIQPVDLVRATENDQTLIEHLYGYYLHDLSEFSGDLDPSATGEFDTSVISTYFERDEQQAFKIMLGRKTIGFILGSEAQNPNIDFVIQDAFVLRGHRRRGIGTKILRILFETYPGRYWLAVLKTNEPALGFWQRSLHSLGIDFQMGEMELHDEICDTMAFESNS